VPPGDLASTYLRHVDIARASAGPELTDFPSDTDITCPHQAAALSAAEPSPGRLQILDFPGNITVINDAFNANPESMTAGLRSFAAYAASRRTVAVLGEMRELGPDAQAAHHAIGKLVAELGIHLLITAGLPRARPEAISPNLPSVQTYHICQMTLCSHDIMSA
jgi:UDP-N-acetylmuramoyl-tripeptide--D-alanyl-D-alanine ligase